MDRLELAPCATGINWPLAIKAAQLCQPNIQLVKILSVRSIIMSWCQIDPPRGIDVDFSAHYSVYCVYQLGVHHSWAVAPRVKTELQTCCSWRKPRITLWHLEC